MVIKIYDNINGKLYREYKQIRAILVKMFKKSIFGKNLRLNDNAFISDF